MECGQFSRLVAYHNSNLSLEKPLVRFLLYYLLATFPAIFISITEISHANGVSNNLSHGENTVKRLSVDEKIVDGFAEANLMLTSALAQLDGIIAG